MQSSKIPIKKTGWLYLWLGLMVMGVWGEQKGYFDPLELFNLKLWSNEHGSNANPSNLIRVLDINFDLNGLHEIQMLAKKFPQATFAFIGHYSGAFLEQLSKPKYVHLAEKSVLLSAHNNSSVSALKKSPSSIDHLMKLEWLNPVLELNNINWQSHAQTKLALQPAPSISASQLIWRNGHDYYPSFIAQVIINNEQAKAQDHLAVNLDFSFENKLKIAKHSYNFGYRGAIYAYGWMPKITPYKQLLNSQKKMVKPIILIDDLSNKGSDVIALSLSSLTSGEHLYSSWLTLILKYLLMLGVLFGVFWMKNLSVKQQTAIVLSGIIFLFLLQSFFIVQYLWISLSLIILLSLVSWILQLGYSTEMNYFMIQNKQRNELLIDATPIFYNTQNLEKLLPHLEQSNPNVKLIDSVYEIAIEAEAHRNTSLAKRLHEWILSHNRHFSPSLERMSELAPDAGEESELEQTLVIDADGEKVTSPVSSILNVTNFGRYQVDGILGKGAMGVVFQGVDPKINRYVAIKTLQLNDDLDGESLIETKQRFFREAETAGNLSHANIVTIYDVGEQRQVNSNRTLGYIAMDLLTGAPLSEFIKKGKLLPPSLVYQLMIQMTDALDYAHRQKVIHRDIKPANIIYDDDLQRGTLTDFGIAYMSDHSKTKTGTIMGSPYYMSPEQILGTKIDGRSDIFSLGVTFYQLLSGHLPFTGESIASVAFHITKTKHESIKQWNKKLPSSAARIINKALQKEADKRFQSMQEFKQALTNALKRDYKKSPLS